MVFNIDWIIFFFFFFFIFRIWIIDAYNFPYEVIENLYAKVFQFGGLSTIFNFNYDFIRLFVSSMRYCFVYFV